MGFVSRVHISFPYTMCHAPRPGMKREGQSRLETSLHDPSPTPLYTSLHTQWQERHDSHNMVWSAGKTAAAGVGAFGSGRIVYGSAAGFGGSSSSGSCCAFATGLLDAPASGQPQRLRSSRLRVLQAGRRIELTMASAQVRQSHALRSLGAPRWRSVVLVPHPPTGWLRGQQRPHRLVTVTAAPRVSFVSPPFQCKPISAAEISCLR